MKSLNVKNEIIERTKFHYNFKLALGDTFSGKNTTGLLKPKCPFLYAPQVNLNSMSRFLNKTAIP